MNTTAWLLAAAAYGCVGMVFMHAAQCAPRHFVEDDEYNDLRVLYGDRTIALIIAAAWGLVFTVWPLTFAVGAPWHFWWHRLSKHPTWDCSEPDDTYDRDDDPRCNRQSFSWVIRIRTR
ncbi:hypothetical protein I5Q34_13005 [Streptomyces sp. AV19]|uniref:hypothetical protein n=1 Tax=Streptomyces sp. AV19 TaxID=2793068 RepID=UPI0018FE95E7|nr:hypothetical protein [Streptomyces sp. AV19]MBH1935182.1 hypothetical protein [Streptomyces sp. AV19]MDG4532010.1 hypothetical protein [Streptomyces sp. AV19]